MPPLTWDFDTIVERLLPTVEYHQNVYARHLEQYMDKGTCWLDIGAGPRLHGGWLSADEEDLVSQCEYIVGCDLLAAHLQSNTHLSYATAADVYALPFATSSFDLITANMVLEHLDEPQRAFSEIDRVLAAGGYFIFVTPNRQHPLVACLHHLIPSSLKRRLAHWSERRSDEHIFDTYYRCNSLRDLSSLTSSTDLRFDTSTVFFSYPVFRHPALATIIEALMIRALQSMNLNHLGSNIVGVLQKEGQFSVRDE